MDFVERLTHFFEYLTDRLSEASTHAALSSVFLTTGVTTGPGTLHDWAITLSLVFGSIGILLRDAK